MAQQGPNQRKYRVRIPGHGDVIVESDEQLSRESVYQRALAQVKETEESGGALGPIGQFFEPAELVTSVGTGGVGALLGKGGVKAGRTLARFRPFNLGRLGDVKRMSKAVRGLGTVLQPSGSEEALQAATKGSGAADLLSQSLREGRERLFGMLDPPHPAFPARATQRTELEKLFAELAETNPKVFSPKGDVRGTSNIMTPLRERAEIVRDIDRLLVDASPEARALNQAIQQQFARGSEVQRLFGAPGVFGGTAGFDQGALQAAFGRRKKMAEKILPPEFRQRLMRGFTSEGTTPRTDVSIAGPGFSVRTGARGRVTNTPLEIGRFLSAPNTRLMQGLTSREIEHLMTILGAAKGATLGPGLSRSLQEMFSSEP